MDCTPCTNRPVLADPIFNTGDVVELDIPGRTITSNFVKRGENFSLANTKAIMAPFDPSMGSGQNFTLELSDNSIVAVEYDEATNEVNVGGTSYSAHESFLLDGKKTTVVSVR